MANPEPKLPPPDPQPDPYPKAPPVTPLPEPDEPDTDVIGPDLEPLPA
jgi:hypothetical protein